MIGPSVLKPGWTPQTVVRILCELSDRRSFDPMITKAMSDFGCPCSNVLSSLKIWSCALKIDRVNLRFGSRDDTMGSSQNHFTIDNDTSTVWTVRCDKETLPWIFTISSDFGSTKDTSRDWIFIWFIYCNRDIVNAKWNQCSKMIYRWRTFADR